MPDLGADPYIIALEMFYIYAPVVAIFSGYSVVIVLITKAGEFFANIFK